MTKRERFLAVSLKLIHEKGFKATTMRDIAKELNCEVANIYNYVDSKQGLLETYLFGISKEFHSSIEKITNNQNTSQEKLQQIIKTHVHLMAKKPYELALLVNEWRNLKEPKLSAFLTERAIYEQSVKSIIQKGINNGEFRALDLDIATFTFLSTLRWLHDKYTEQGEHLDPEEIEKQITTFVFKGILI